jgi:hypothetical protein
MFSSLFRGKKNTTNTTRRSNKNMRNAAATQAHWKVRSQYGRAEQSRVANFLRPEEGRHNIVAKEKKVLAEKTFSELEDISKGITPEQEKVISSVRDTIQSQVKSAAQSGADRITISVPTFVGSLLVRVLGILLGLALLGGLIAAFIIAPFITGSAVGLSIAGAGALGLYGGLIRKTYLEHTPAGLAARAHANWRDARAREVALEAMFAQGRRPYEPGARNRAYRNAYFGMYRKMNEEEAAEAEVAAGKIAQWRGASTGAVPRAASMAEINLNGPPPNGLAPAAADPTAAQYREIITLHRREAIAAAQAANAAAADAAEAGRVGDTIAAEAAAAEADAAAAAATTAAAEVAVTERRIAEAGFTDLAKMAADATAGSARAARTARIARANAANWVKYAAATAAAEAAGRDGGGAVNRNTRNNRN